MRTAILTTALVIICIFTNAYAEDAPPEPQWRVGITATGSPDELLPLYSKPSSSSLTLGGYYSGVALLFLDEPDGADALVPVCVGEPDSPSSMTGYMERSRLIEWNPSDPESDKPVPYSPVLIVQNPSPPGWLNIRERPSSDSRVIGQRPNGTLAVVLGVVGEWLHVETETAVGYMAPQCLSPISEAQTLATDEFTFGPESIPVTIQLLGTGLDSPAQIVRALDDRHDVIQTLAVQSAGRLDRDANFILEDMNFDGYPDFRVLTEYANNETRYQYWLFDPDNNPDDPVNRWRFVRADAYEILPNEPAFDAQVQRIYTHSSLESLEYPTSVDSVYDLDGGAPRLIEELWTISLPDGATRFRLYELQGGEVELMHEWEESLGG